MTPPKTGPNARIDACKACGSHPRDYQPQHAEGRSRGKVIHCWVCGSTRCNWRLGWRERSGSPYPPPAARASFAAAVEEENTAVRASLARRRLAAVEKALANAPKPKVRKLTFLESQEQSRSLRGDALWEAFEASAWKHGAANASVAVPQDEAAEWLRRYEAKRQHVRVDEPNESGVAYLGGGMTLRTIACTIDYRGELLEQARAGDEYAQWRASELFVGMAFGKRKKAG